MAKRTGSVRKHRGKWTARLVYLDPETGKLREYRRSADSKAAANDLLREMEQSIHEAGGGYSARERRTFSDLADYYIKHYAQPAQYVDGRKVFGLRSDYGARYFVNLIRKRFGAEAPRSVRGDIVAKIDAGQD